MSLVLANFNGFTKSLKSIRFSYILTDDEIGPDYGKHAAGEMSLVLANSKDSTCGGGRETCNFNKVYRSNKVSGARKF